MIGNASDPGWETLLGAPTRAHWCGERIAAYGEGLLEAEGDAGRSLEFAHRHGFWMNRPGAMWKPRLPTRYDAEIDLALEDVHAFHLDAESVPHLDNPLGASPDQPLASLVVLIEIVVER